MYVHLYTPPTSLTDKHNDNRESEHILIYSQLLIVYLYLIVLSPKSLKSI
jgi:hypothetical protein